MPNGGNREAKNYIMVNQEIVNIFAKGALNFYFQIKGKMVCRSLYKCKGGRKKDLFIYPDIPKNDVAYYVRREFKIPYEEEILFVRDTSFGNNKNQGLVITDWGIRERPDNDKYEINEIS